MTVIVGDANGLRFLVFDGQRRSRRRALRRVAAVAGFLGHQKQDGNKISGLHKHRTDQRLSGCRPGGTGQDEGHDGKNGQRPDHADEHPRCKHQIILNILS